MVLIKSVSGKQYHLDWYYEGASGTYVGQIRWVNSRRYGQVMAQSFDIMLSQAISNLQLIEAEAEDEN